jgi:hypothetical protein
MLSVSTLYECMMIDKRWIWKEAVMADWRYYSGIWIERLRKSTIALSRDNLCRGWTPPNTSLERYL